MPPPTAPARDALLVRVRACGVNPVDAKGVVGDKLPAFLRPLARRALDGTIAGFDLSGVVDRAPPNSGFAVGDEVFGAVPPFRGSFAERGEPLRLDVAQLRVADPPDLGMVQRVEERGIRSGEADIGAPERAIAGDRIGTGRVGLGVHRRDDPAEAFLGWTLVTTYLLPIPRRRVVSSTTRAFRRARHG